jgi:hypothetical protein
MPRPLLLLIAVLVPVALQALALLNPDVPIIDCEERYNAAHALALARHPLALLRLQYRDFCGGCTFVSALGAVPLAVLPAVFASWKVVALGFTGLLSGTGFWLLDRRQGRAPAVIFVLLVALMPWNLVRLALLSWGNHVEAGVLAVVMLALLWAKGPWSRLAAGLVGGLGVWVGFTMAPLVVGAFAIIALRREWSALKPFCLGLLLAPALWAAQWGAAGTSPFGTIYIPGEATPDLLRAPKKLLSLLAPQQVAGVWGLPDLQWGVPLGYAWVASLVVALVMAVRGGGVGREAAVIAFAWFGAYLSVGFTLEMPPWPEVAPPPGLRYSAPLYPFAFLVVAAVAGRWWAAGRRGLTVLLLAGPLAAGVAARAATLTAPFPDAFAFRLRAADLPYFRVQASYLLRADEHETCGAPSEGVRSFHAYAEGRADARRALEASDPLAALVPPPNRPSAAYFEGVGGQTIDVVDNLSTGAVGLLGQAAILLSDLPEQAQASAMDEALWRRVWGGKRWSLGRGELDEDGVYALRQRVRVLPKSARPAAMRAYGRRLAREVARTGQPTRLSLPVELPHALWEGIGDGLGAEWGPRSEIPRPDGLPEAAEASFLEGYRRGQGRQWRGGVDAPAPRLTDAAWPDLDADRWWGPAPQLLCPCGATCE